MSAKKDRRAAVANQPKKPSLKDLLEISPDIANKSPNSAVHKSTNDADTNANADSIMAAVSSRMDSQMQVMCESISKQFQNLQNTLAAQMQELKIVGNNVKADSESLKDYKNSLDLQMAAMTQSPHISENPHSLTHHQPPFSMPKPSHAMAINETISTETPTDNVHPTNQAVNQHIYTPMTPLMTNHTPNIAAHTDSHSEFLYATRRLHDLQTFSGVPEDWPVFINTFNETTKTFGYSQLENTIRLQKCLQGTAKETVASLLIHPQNVNEVLSLLEFTFGRPDLLIRSQLLKVQQFQPVVDARPELLIRFAVKVKNLAAFLQTLKSEHHMANPTLIDELLSKLPLNYRIDWAKFAINIKPFPTISHFSEWLDQNAKLLAFVTDCTSSHTGPLFHSTSPHNVSSQSNVKLQSNSLSSNVNRRVNDQNKFSLFANESIVCQFCSGPHKTYACEDYRTKSVKDRWELVKRNRLCFACLGHDHSLTHCRKAKVCGVKNCRRKHHFTLHDDKQPTDSIQNSKLRVNYNVNSAESTVLFRILPVKFYGPNGSIDTFAFLDEGSSVSLIDCDVAQKLGLKGPQKQLTLKWFQSYTSTKPSMTVNLEISGIDNTYQKYYVRNVQTVENIDLPKQTLDIEKLKRLFKEIESTNIKGYINAVPKILIGVDNCHLGVSQQCHMQPNKPIVTKTKLGYIVYGPTSDSQEMPSKRVMVVQSIAAESQLDLIKQMVDDYFSIESLPVKVINLDSNENKRALEIMNSTTKRVGERFETGLLWKSDSIKLPDSFSTAMRRLEGIERKMKANDKFAAEYRLKINEYIKTGYARKLSKVEARQTNSKTWYLPHFAVRNPNKPGKMRLVFDAAAQSGTISLNDALLSGPDLNKPLLKVLFRFREATIGVVGDIKEMFHQIRIRREDLNAQRFLWRGSTFENEVDTYVMNVMIFGATCSPSLAQYVKNKNASEYTELYPKAVEAIINKHYVDDYVDCFSSEDEAIEVCREVIHIHKKAGFELRSFVSNSPLVANELNGIRTSKNNNTELNVNIHDHNERVLGLRWSTNEDQLIFFVKFHRVPDEILSGSRLPTKREMLSLTMSLFDPFGFLANFTLHSKVLLQEVWKTNLAWDDTLPEDIHRKWKLWLDEIHKIELFTAPRCYSPRFLVCKNLQLHVFVDASEEAYATVTYWRMETENGVELSFVAAKSRCAPQKIISIPRLELQAAVLGIRLKNAVVENHSVKVNKCIFWSDSKSVIGWIQSDQRKYKSYVAHRIGEILEHSDAGDWRWIPSKINPADDATRAKFPPKYQPNSRWINGPEFLLASPASWPINVDKELWAECVEELRIKRCNVVTSGAAKENTIDWNRFSNYLRLKRAIGWVLRFVTNVTAKRLNKAKISSNELTSIELEESERKICQLVQMTAFADEYFALNNNQSINKHSTIYQLTPYIDEYGVIRLHGRIDYANVLPMSGRRPIILPTKHKLTKLIVDYFHQKFHHQNQELVIAQIRNKFWIPSLRSLVKNIKTNCYLCRIRTTLPKVPIMGQLPPDRLTPYVSPFTYVGLDYFGPYNVSIGRRREKRWVALFTCLTTRAIHLELSVDLSTDACLLCIRNFVNRRGVPIRIRSDNGTNFVGVKRELRDQQFFDNDRIQAAMSSIGIEWLFNCPANPSEGGCWERLVRSVKRVLSFTLKEAAPRPETLNSLLIEAENIINSRPLTHLPVSGDEDEPLTPNHFLLGKMNSTQTPGPCETICLRKQWRISQQLKNCFWKRWVAEYLPELTKRSKWFNKTKPIEVDNLVIICDSTCSRSQWRRGRVIRVYKGKDGVIRSADVKTQEGILKRPVSKLAILDIESKSSPPSIYGGEDVEDNIK